MKFTLPFALAAVILTANISTANAASSISTFDDLPLASESYYFPTVTTSFSSGSASFQHNYDSNYGSWDGFLYSNQTDVMTEGYGNQYSAFTGGGVNGSANYGLAYYSSYSGTLPTISFAGDTLVSGAFFSNTTYTGLSMQNGDPFAKKFGGDSGNDADFLKLVINGLDANGNSTGTVDFFLADYRFADNSQDYILKSWSFVDLTSLGAVTSLQFTMQSSDVGVFGINTPTYFAVDNLTVTPVPEPATNALMVAGLMLLGFVARRKNI